MQIAYKFDAVTLRKMGISALMLAGGSILTYVGDNVLRLIGAVGIPDAYKPVAVSVFTWVINAIKEWMSGQSTV